jgi:hypothetical protein
MFLRNRSPCGNTLSCIALRRLRRSGPSGPTFVCSRPRRWGRQDASQWRNIAYTEHGQVGRQGQVRSKLIKLIKLLKLIRLIKSTEYRGLPPRKLIKSTEIRRPAHQAACELTGIGKLGKMPSLEQFAALSLLLSANSALSAVRIGGAGRPNVAIASLLP